MMLKKSLTLLKTLQKNHTNYVVLKKQSFLGPAFYELFFILFFKNLRGYDEPTFVSLNVGMVAECYRTRFLKK